MKWILIGIVYWYHAPAAIQQEFSTQQACESAKGTFLREFYSRGWINGASSETRAICVAK